MEPVDGVSKDFGHSVFPDCRSTGGMRSELQVRAASKPAVSVRWLRHGDIQRRRVALAVLQRDDQCPFPRTSSRRITDRAWARKQVPSTALLEKTRRLLRPKPEVGTRGTSILHARTWTRSSPSLESARGQCLLSRVVSSSSGQRCRLRPRHRLSHESAQTVTSQSWRDPRPCFRPYT
jgi:hypothetical protein